MTHHPHCVDPLPHVSCCMMGISMEEHTTFYDAVVQSPQWQAWEKVAQGRGWDVDESRETGWLSQKHFQAFLEFCGEVCSECQFEEGHSNKCSKYKRATLEEALSDVDLLREAAKKSNEDQRKAVGL